MPVEIVSGNSNPANGEINQNDLKRIVQDFENFVTLESGFSRPILKTNSIAIPLSVIRAFVRPTSEEDATSDDYINIHYGMTLPGQKSCEDFETDISNQLTVVINKAKKNGSLIIDNIDFGQFIITAGFKSSLKMGDEVLCCGKPGGGGGGSQNV